ALVRSEYRIDEGVPAASLFDHVITAIPQGDSYLFVDTTPEVAPLGFLLNVLRGKQALVIPANGPAKLVRTPTEPPFPSKEKFRMDASITTSGVLDGKVRWEDRGDSEVVVRNAFRNTPQNKWKDLAQNLMVGLGYGGTVSDVDAEPPENTKEPFWSEYSYHRADYSEWRSHRITLPFPPFLLPELTEKQKASKEAMPIGGGRQEVIYEAAMKLPEDVIPIVPPNAERKTDFGEYTATYKFENGTLSGTRRLALKADE